jgi:L-lactate dehydrogenase complex protein LldF
LDSYGRGQQVTVYNSIITGPKQPHEANGPEDMYVILLDNGRTHLLANSRVREALYCICCGACLNACPVYKNIGGHSYNTTDSVAIGSVITPHLKGMTEYQNLSFASSLCGNCTQVCPVHIILHELLLENRYESVLEGNSSLTERLVGKACKTASLHRKMMNTGNGVLKNIIVNQLFKKWIQHRSPLQFADNTFNELWQQQ